MKAKVTAEILEALRRDIVSGHLPRQSRLPSERDMAAHFGVSQPTIREVVRSLETLGLVEVRHGSGIYVAPDTQQLVAMSLLTVLQLEDVGLLEVLEVRGMLGVSSARHAAQRATAEDVERLELIAEGIERMDRSVTVREIASQVVAFQVALSAATHNPLLYQLESYLIGLLMQLQLMAKEAEGTDAWLALTDAFAEDRRQLVSAVRDRDEEATVAAITSYLRDQHDYFVADESLAGVRLADPSSVVSVASFALDVPDFSVPRAHAQ